MEDKRCDLCNDNLAPDNELNQKRSSYKAIIEQFLYSYDESDHEEEPIDNRQD